MHPQVEALRARLRRAVQARGRRARVMEVCGTHTHAIARAGLRQLIDPDIDLVSGPGCPVCVTARADVERMLQLAGRHEVIVATFGDMLRVPGETGSLEEARARGGDVRVVYSPRDALQMAVANPGREVAFLAVGFETTAPAVAATVLQAVAAGVPNLSFAVAHKLIPPAMRAILAEGAVLDGFLTPGHVSVVIGTAAYAEIAVAYQVACVTTGFEPQDILEGLAMLVERVAAGRYEAATQYTRAVGEGGNPRALHVMDQVFEVDAAEWRGLGLIPNSGLRLRDGFRSLDAYHRFGVPREAVPEDPSCRCGEVLRGRLAPPDCALFGQSCTPVSPVGPCMVSAEGACAARYKYG